jgi:uncharacterized protein (TIGR02145 family)
MKPNYFVSAIAFIYLAVSVSAQETASFKDSRDGKTYKTIAIGSQIWMAENLAFKADNFCWAYNNDEKNVPTYGYLYSWESAKNACPSGWRLPSDAEWTILTEFTGGDTITGAKLKEAGFSHWLDSIAVATNESGFTALPGGRYERDGKSKYLGHYGHWWTSTDTFTLNAWFRQLNYDFNSVHRDYNTKKTGFSVRCIKNKE